MRLRRGRSVALLLVWAWMPVASAQSFAAPDALALYHEGEVLYLAGDYPAAIDAFARAYALTHAKDLLFNIAQAHRLWGPVHCEEAVDYYERYLAADPNASNQQEVQERIALLKPCALALQTQRRQREAIESARPLATPAAVVVSPLPRKPLPWAPFAIGGLALGAAGGVVYWQAVSEFNRAKQRGGSYPPGTFAGWQAATDASYGAIALGAAALCLGTVLWIRSPRGEVAVVPTPTGVSASGRF